MELIKPPKQAGDRDMIKLNNKKFAETEKEFI